MHNKLYKSVENYSEKIAFNFFGGADREGRKGAGMSKDRSGNLTSDKKETSLLLQTLSKQTN